MTSDLRGEGEGCLILGGQRGTYGAVGRRVFLAPLVGVAQSRDSVLMAPTLKFGLRSISFVLCLHKNKHISNSPKMKSAV